jgi:hypothetical protein
MLAAPAKIQPILHTRWNNENSQPHFCSYCLYKQNIRLLFASPAGVSKIFDYYLPALPGLAKYSTIICLPCRG